MKPNDPSRERLNSSQRNKDGKNFPERMIDYLNSQRPTPELRNEPTPQGDEYVEYMTEEQRAKNKEIDRLVAAWQEQSVKVRNQENLRDRFNLNERSDDRPDSSKGQDDPEHAL